MPEVSVIIPIYNTAAYLRKALDNICGQTLKELEIILIDDGSTDGSHGIIEEYAKRDARIRWYAQPNQGLSVARNRGLLHATGKYIYFMDSDDILDTQALRHCHDLCEKRELDFIFFDAKPLTESADSQNIPNYDRKGKIDESVHSGMEMLDYELSNRLFLTPVYLCMVNRLFLKKMLHLLSSRHYPRRPFFHYDDLSECTKNMLRSQGFLRAKDTSPLHYDQSLRNAQHRGIHHRMYPNAGTRARTSRMENGHPQIPVLHPERCNLGGTPDVAA